MQELLQPQDRLDVERRFLYLRLVFLLAPLLLLLAFGPLALPAVAVIGAEALGSAALIWLLLRHAPRVITGGQLALRLLDCVLVHLSLLSTRPFLGDAFDLAYIVIVVAAAASHGALGTVLTTVAATGGILLGRLEAGAGTVRLDPADLPVVLLYPLLFATTGSLVTSLMRKSAATAAAAERRLRDLLQGLDAIVWEADAATFRVTFVNRRAEELLGYPVEWWLKTPNVWQLLVHPADLDRVLGECIAAVVDGRDHELEYRVITADGRTLWVHDMTRVLAGDSGRPAQLRGVLVDVTARKRTERELTEANRRLREALIALEATQKQVVRQERLQALGQMASGIAHDLNNALSPVVGFAEWLLKDPRGLEDREQVRRYLHLIHTGAQDAAGVVRRLREFYRPREAAEVLAAIDLKQLVEQTMLLTQPRWQDQAQAGGAQITVQLDLRPVPPVLGIETELREALMNLIFNAVDAMPAGGTLTLRTYTTGQHAVVEVRDTGTGMTDVVRERCLEPFFSTKGEHGTGLGLAITHGTVRRHGGTLAFTTAPGQGTTFTISLPVRQDPAPEVPQEAPAADGSSSGPLTILVVDDEPDVRRVITALLASDGHTVVAAAGGNEALAHFRAGAFDLVLTDQAMPDMSGDQVAAAIKQLAPEVPVALVTGFGDLMLSAAQTPPGVDAVVAKPVTLASLRQTVASLASAAARGHKVGRQGAG